MLEKGQLLAYRNLVLTQYRRLATMGRSSIPVSRLEDAVLDVYLKDKDEDSLEDFKNATFAFNEGLKTLMHEGTLRKDEGPFESSDFYVREALRTQFDD